jgi:deoxycytidylate deaminase
MNKFEKYFELAKFNANLFSKDPNTKVGAILLKPDLSAVVSTGINGFPRKLQDTDPQRWERPTKYTYVTHAEVNAVANAARIGVCHRWVRCHRDPVPVQRVCQDTHSIRNLTHLHKETRL